MSILVRPLALAFCVLVSPTFLGAQKQATIVHNANLRADPSTDNPPIQALAQGAHVFVIDASLQMASITSGQVSKRKGGSGARA